MTVTDSERTSSLNHPRENQPEAFVGAAQGKKKISLPSGIAVYGPFKQSFCHLLERTSPRMKL